MGDKKHTFYKIFFWISLAFYALVAAFGLHVYNNRERFEREAKIVVGVDIYALPKLILHEPFRIFDKLFTLLEPKITGLPLYEVTISDKQLRKMLRKPDTLKDASSLDWKKGKAVFKYRDRAYDVKMKIRGSLPDHWGNPKKSYRIIFKANDLFFGKKSIDMIIPRDRYVLVEQASNRRAGKMGLLVPDTQIALLKINGVYQGAYFEVEHWGKNFLERNHFPDCNLYGADNVYYSYKKGSIFDDLQLWRKYAAGKDSPFNDFSEMERFIKILKEPDRDKFKAEISQILNMDNFYRWQSHAFLQGSKHQSDSHNLRMFFDNTGSQFHLIPWDVALEPLMPYVDNLGNKLDNKILSIPDFRLQRNKVLWDYVSDENNLKDDLKYYDELYRKTRYAFYMDSRKTYSNFVFRRLVQMYRKIMIDNFNIVKEDMNRCDVFFKVALRNREGQAEVLFEGVNNGFAEGLLDKITIPLRDNVALRAEDVRIFSSKTGEYTPGSFEALQKGIKINNADGKVEILLDGYLLGIREKYILYAKTDVKDKVHPAEIYDFDKMEISVRNAVTLKRVNPTVRVVDEDKFSDFAERLDISREELLRKYPFLEIEKGQSDKVVIGPGEHIVTNNVFIPARFMLVIKPGTVMNFSPGISLVSYGAIIAEGTREHPIIFKGDSWGFVGIAEQFPTKTSVFKYCFFKGGKGMPLGGTNFSGMLSAYHTKLYLENSWFEASRSDDAVNVKSGEVIIRSSVFIKNVFDGLDIDFSAGEVRDSYFLANGNDGIDLSGSDFKVINNFIEASGDKGVSVGERSSAVIFNNVIVGGNTGIAVKDGSTARIINSTLVDNIKGVCAYQKKPLFYEETRTVLANSILWNKEKDLEIEEGFPVEIRNSNIRQYSGVKGENVYSREPLFKDRTNKDYTLIDDPQNRVLLSGGRVEAAKPWLPEYGGKDVPVGIIPVKGTPHLNPLP